MLCSIYNIEDGIIISRNIIGEYYVVTDPDISLSEVRGNILSVFGTLLKTHPHLNVIGSSIRIDDIPVDSYSTLGKGKFAI